MFLGLKIAKSYNFGSRQTDVVAMIFLGIKHISKPDFSKFHRGNLYLNLHYL